MNSSENRRVLQLRSGRRTTLNKPLFPPCSDSPSSSSLNLHNMSIPADQHLSLITCEKRHSYQYVCKTAGLHLACCQASHNQVLPLAPLPVRYSKEGVKLDLYQTQKRTLGQAEQAFDMDLVTDALISSCIAERGGGTREAERKGAHPVWQGVAGGQAQRG